LIAKAKDWAQQLGKPVELWMSDQQDAFVQGINAEFPDVPHRFCQNHFLRDLAKPVLEADSHQKVQMRKKVRGLRQIEKQVLADRQAAQGEAEANSAPAGTAQASAAPTKEPAASQSPGLGPPPASVPVVEPPADEAGQVVLDYCAAVRGILNDDQGGPLHPPGLRKAAAMQEVRRALQRNLDAKKGGALRGN